MNKNILLLVISYFFILYLNAQAPFHIIECRYMQTNSSFNDTSKKREYIVRIEKDEIGYWGEREEGITLLSVFNFKKLQYKMIGIYGHVNLFSIEDKRKKVELISCKEQVNSFQANAMISLFEENKPNQYMNETSEIFDTTYFDTCVKIAYYQNGGYINFLDNGFGFLPVKTIRKITRETDPIGYIVTTELVSKKEVLISAEEWEKMLNTY